MSKLFNLKHTTMRTRLLALIIIWLGILGSAFGQTSDVLLDKSGIYMSAADFSSGKLKYEINCLTQKHKIKSSDIFYTPYHHINGIPISKILTA